MTHAQHLTQYAGALWQRLCDCGRPASHKIGPDWECARCQAMRHEFQEGERKQLRRERDVNRRPTGRPCGIRKQL